MENRIEKVCEGCGKRLLLRTVSPQDESATRQNQRNIEAVRQGLCRSCYENAYLVCEQCGSDLPKGMELEDIAAREMSYCLDCYREYEKLHGEDNLPYGYGWLESVQQMYDETDADER